MRGYAGSPALQTHYQHRLKWGLQQLYARFYRQMAVAEE